MLNSLLIALDSKPATIEALLKVSISVLVI